MSRRQKSCLLIQGNMQREFQILARIFRIQGIFEVRYEKLMLKFKYKISSFDPCRHYVQTFEIG